MKRLRNDIRYSFEDLPGGGRVVIVSADPLAIEAIHEFLRFQIEQHKTGDSMNVTENLPQGILPRQARARSASEG